MSIKQWHNDIIGQKVVEALKKNYFDAVYFSDQEGAEEHILQYISPGNIVSFGGSMTLTEDMEFQKKVVAKGGNITEFSYESPEIMAECMRKQLLSDVFLSSSNAVTMDGYLVNIDGVGNRVAAMTFGPKKVILVVGTNKICPDVESAWKRLERIASPMNMKRLELDTPCSKTGYCVDCRSESRGCRIYSVIKRKPRLTDITVVVIGQNLGY